MSVVWWSMLVLFCLSLVPYTTRIAGANFNSAVALGFYGIVITLSTAANIGLNHALGMANADQPELKETLDKYCRSLSIDCAIKAGALVICIFVWPPAMMWGVALAAAFIYTMRSRWTALS